VRLTHGRNGFNGRSAQPSAFSSQLEDQEGSQEDELCILKLMAEA
jgi:hypothetical protein